MTKRNTLGRLTAMVRRTIFAAAVMFAPVVAADALEPFPDGARVVFYGDSITAAGNFAMRIAAHYRKAFPERSVRFYNCGMSGGGVGTAEMYFDTVLMPRRPTHVVLAFGVNDSRNLTPNASATDSKAERRRVDAAAEAFGKRYEALVKRILSRGVKVILKTATPFNEFGEGVPITGGILARHKDSSHARISEIVRGCARRNNLPCVDDYSAMKAAMDKGERLFNSDRLHPDDRGHWRMAETFLSAQGFKIDSWQTRDKEAASAGLLQWDRLSRKIASVNSAEFLVVRDNSLDNSGKLAKVRKWISDHSKLPKGDYMMSISRDYLAFKPQGDAIYDELDALWPSK